MDGGVSGDGSNVYDLDAKRRALEARERSDRTEPELPLKGGGGGGTLGGMDSALIDAKVAAAEARTDTKFERLIGRLDSIDAKLTRIETDNVRTRATVRTTGLSVFAAIVTVLGLLFAVFSQSFSIGTKVSDAAREQAQQVFNARQPSADVTRPSPGRH